MAKLLDVHSNLPPLFNRLFASCVLIGRLRELLDAIRHSLVFRDNSNSESCSTLF